ncbi:class I SAM-dependent methyltransferase [Salinibacterium sp. NG253]|uniref:class I SAM-dependent methyltransferase n=1 Tax=Salinibacterium sp. NG253 TaxID=2792039 RepID=UPI0018CD55C3|nr:class I SAM-dependent methyltransferase [Salinibacterium sp. NG253]MBH0115293.1 class I SAM-dependent methyltransferase [Salinibacterium sp. NG253]
MGHSQHDAQPANDKSRVAPREFWEDRYGDSDHIWSGRVNSVLASIAPTLGAASSSTSRRSLDLGCGEGGDVLWLAQNGWSATGIDISTRAIERAREAALKLSIPSDAATFIAADLSELETAELYDLVTASFLHSPVELARGPILQAAASRVAPGGHLLITSHASPPRGDDHGHPVHLDFPTPEAEVEMLALDPDEWDILLCEERPREVTNHAGEPATTSDAVVLVRRH